MNHIHRITQERDEAQAALAAVSERLVEIEAYLMSAKFAGPDADYVNVRTDMLPKLASVRFLAMGA